LQAAVAGIVQHVRPGDLGLADDHRFGVARHLVGTKRGVKAAHHDRNFTPAIFGRDLVGTLGGVGLDADGDEVGGLVERNVLHPVVVEFHGDILRGEAGEGGGGQRLHLPGADVFLPGPAADAGVDDGESHRT
jgi:hypothetical protein